MITIAAMLALAIACWCAAIDHALRNGSRNALIAHLDRQGRLREITGVEWSPIFKFLLAIVLTLAISLATYQYFVRHTPINKLLNGHRARRMS